ncbi:MAG TPA: hypothetical protein VGE60_07655 [Telluria sp.]
MLGVVMLLSLGVLAACTDSRDAELVAEMEASLSMPQGADELNKYARFYVIETTRGKREVLGVLLKRPSDPGVHIVKKNALPVRFDGGCGVVNVRYSPADKTFLHVSCNGGA